MLSIQAIKENVEAFGSVLDQSSLLSAPGRLPRRLKRDGETIEVVLVIDFSCREPAGLLPGLAVASNSSRKRIRPPSRNSTKTSAAEFPSGWM